MSTCWFCTGKRKRRKKQPSTCNTYFLKNGTNTSNLGVTHWSLACANMSPCSTCFLRKKSNTTKQVPPIEASLVPLSLWKLRTGTFVDRCSQEQTVAGPMSTFCFHSLLSQTQSSKSKFDWKIPERVQKAKQLDVLTIMPCQLADPHASFNLLCQTRRSWIETRIFKLQRTKQPSLRSFLRSLHHWQQQPAATPFPKGKECINSWSKEHSARYRAHGNGSGCYTHYTPTKKTTNDRCICNDH